MMVATKNREKISRELVISEYGKTRLLDYADTFRDLAVSFPAGQLLELEEPKRRSRLEKSRLLENVQVLSQNMGEMSRILQEIAGEVFAVRRIPDRQARFYMKALKQEKILVEDIFYLAKGEKRPTDTLCVRMSTGKQGGYLTTEVADMISVLLDRRLISAPGVPYYLGKDVQNYFFVEEPGLTILTGHAKAIREMEQVSGDSFSISQGDNGHVSLLVSDGMGSGTDACKESGQVIDLMERLLEAGYQIPTAINLVNNVMLFGGEETNMSTLDLCDIDLYTGVCRFHKIGGATTFIKKGRYVEDISVRNLPLGIFSNVDQEPVEKELGAGDYVIMVTDGVLNTFSGDSQEELLKLFVGEMQENTPAAMANEILSFAIRGGGGHIQDDMLVLVAGIFPTK